MAQRWNPFLWVLNSHHSCKLRIYIYLHLRIINAYYERQTVCWIGWDPGSINVACKVSAEKRTRINYRRQARSQVIFSNSGTATAPHITRAPLFGLYRQSIHSYVSVFLRASICCLFICGGWYPKIWFPTAIENLQTLKYTQPHAIALSTYSFITQDTRR